jgi:hypothetical protein
VVPMRYEHYLHNGSKSVPVIGRRGPLGVFSVRYEHYINIKSKAIPVTGRGRP